jgi:hypothetical protein
MRVSIAALAAVCTALSCNVTAQEQCPAGQYLCSTHTETGMVRVIPVPGNAGGIGSGIFIRPGFTYKMTATGSIRVGVFGETGTPPEGWVPQGPAGNGYPAPDSYTFSLLFRVGSTGPWQWLGGQGLAKLGPRDAAGAELMFGINDNNLGNNTGSFAVTVTEVAVGTKCCVSAAPVSGFYGLFKASPSQRAPRPTSTSNQPCAGRTPDGQKQSFQFPLYCSSTFNRYIPVEACTRAEALAEAQAHAKSQPPNCYLAER